MAVSKALSLQDIRTNVDRFVAEWKDETAEQAESQSFWNDFLSCFGIERRRVATFERRAKRASTANTGRIDVFWPRVMIAEQKSAGILTRDAERAESQADDYLLGGDIEPHEFPRYILTSDFQTMRLTDLEAEGGRRTLTIDLVQLRDHIEDFAWIAGYEARKFSTDEEQAASVKAAGIMANLYVALVGDTDLDNVTDQDDEDSQSLAASILLTRLLFLLFGDDAGLWEKGLFEDFIGSRTAEDGSDLGPQLNALFEILNTAEAKRSPRADEVMLQFPYVNGELYSGREPTMFFDRTMRVALIDACHFDWTSISPAVFGSLFQAIKSKAARRADGEHYTTETNILKTIEPLFLDDVRAKVAKAWNSAKALREVHDSFADMRYLDPACGCGNFLIVAYREMRKIELEVLVRLRELGKHGGQLSLKGEDELKVSLDQFYGIEINWWPAKIAEVAMFLVDHQANREMALNLGQAPNRLPINIAPKIAHANALDVDWRTVLQPTSETLVFGNPPFVGHKEREKTQANELRRVWGRNVAHLDYVTAWYAKAADYLRGLDTEWAFVSTNSIVMGEGVPLLFGRLLDEGWQVKFAHRTFAWTSEATGKAAVHVVIVGFTRKDGWRRLFDYATPKSEPHEARVANINPYLVDGPNVLVSARSTALRSDFPAILAGSTPIDWGSLTEFNDDELDALRADPVASKYLRRYAGGKELINGNVRWCLWMDTPDFEASDIVASPILKSRVEKVRAEREDSGRAATRLLAATPHLFGERRQPKSETYLGIPQTFAEGRFWATAARLDQTFVPSIKLFTAEDADGFLFAIVSSSMFITWQKTVGGRLKSDPSFSSSLVWNNLPLPQVNPATRKKIIAAGQGVIRARALHPDRSLAEHYNPLAMDPALVAAHRKLDAVVDRAFGATKTLTTERERQAILFQRYLDLTDPLNVTSAT